MTSITEEEISDKTTSKSSRSRLLLGLVLAVVGGLAGFFLTRTNLLPFNEAEPGPSIEKTDDTVITPDVRFVALDPITVTLPPGSGKQLLRLTAQLDVAPKNADAVIAIMPRILDILNTYLRAIDVADMEAPASLIRLRTQMLHRVQVVAGQGVVRDLLITEFILN